MKKRNLTAMLLVVLLVTASFTGCGGKESAAPAPAIEADEPVAEAPAEEPETETIEEVPEAVLPEGEKLGVAPANVMESEKDFVLYSCDSDGNEVSEVDGYTLEKTGGCKTVIESVKVAPAEEEGFETYTVNILYDLSMKHTADWSKIDNTPNCSWVYPSYGLCDYYTGTSNILNYLVGDDEEGIAAAESVELKWEDKEAVVKASIDFGEDEPRIDRKDSGNTSVIDCNYPSHSVITVTVPVGYDGMLLYIDKEGYKGSDKASYDKAYEIDGGYELASMDESFVSRVEFIKLSDVAVSE